MMISAVLPLHPLLLFCRYRSFILLLTFLFYTAYHLSRKPISIVKVTGTIQFLFICSFHWISVGVQTVGQTLLLEIMKEKKSPKCLCFPFVAPLFLAEALRYFHFNRRINKQTKQFKHKLNQSFVLNISNH